MYETCVGNGEDVVKYHAVMVEIAIYFVEFGDINKFATKDETVSWCPLLLVGGSHLKGLYHATYTRWGPYQL